jgi:hypothetical protein
MEPRQHKLLAEVLLVLGIAAVIIGLAVYYLASMKLEGTLIIVAGCIMSLLSLPTFMILAILTATKKD